MAVDSDKGLMVPVIRDAHNLGIAGLATAIADKAAKVRGGQGTQATEVGDANRVRRVCARSTGCEMMRRDGR